MALPEEQNKQMMTLEQALDSQPKYFATHYAVKTPLLSGQLFVLRDYTLKKRVRHVSKAPLTT